MNQNIDDAKANLGEAKDDIKDLISEEIDSAKAHISEHVENMSDATKDAIVDVAKTVQKAADSVVGKMSKPEETTEVK